MQTLDDMVKDFVPPLTDTYRRVYEARYLYRPRPSIKSGPRPGAEPTIPGCLLAERRRTRSPKGRSSRKRRSRQQGGVIPLLALLAPALAAAGKAAALRRCRWGPAGYAAKRGLAAATRRR